jgi:hypothetical protein
VWYTFIVKPIATQTLDRDRARKNQSHEWMMGFDAFVLSEADGKTSVRRIGVMDAVALRHAAGLLSAAEAFSTGVPLGSTFKEVAYHPDCPDASAAAGLLVRNGQVAPKEEIAKQILSREFCEQVCPEPEEQTFQLGFRGHASALNFSETKETDFGTVDVSDQVGLRFAADPKAIGSTDERDAFLSQALRLGANTNANFGLVNGNPGASYYSEAFEGGLYSAEKLREYLVEFHGLEVPSFSHAADRRRALDSAARVALAGTEKCPSKRMHLSV